MDFSKYTSYSFQDFFEDDDFVGHVIAPSHSSQSFFETLYSRFPEKEGDIKIARDFIISYRTQDAFFNQSRQAALWAKIEAGAAQVPVQASIIKLSRIMRAAAAILIIGLGMFLFYYNRPQNFYSKYGEIKTVSMADGTTVVLNGNSSLSFQRGFGKNEREVWLKGEGFFKVKHLNKDSAHIKPGERFIVHCNDLNIEVLGTSFNVLNRHGKTNVGLVTGKIRLVSNEPKRANHSLTLAPGDYIEYAQKKVLIKQRLNHPDKLSGWSKREFIFKNEKLKNILSTLEDAYGYDVKYKNAATMDMEIEGEINVKGVSDLLETISTSLHVNIYQNNNQIIIN